MVIHYRTIRPLGQWVHDLSVAGASLGSSSLSKRRLRPRGTGCSDSKPCDCFICAIKCDHLLGVAVQHISGPRVCEYILAYGYQLADPLTFAVNVN